MARLALSTKEQIVRTAERLFATHGLDGVSLRQIGAAAGNNNNSAVQYHFGSKEQLIQDIFEYRQPYLFERRRLLVAQLRPRDLRSWIECFFLPILEQGEQEDGCYLRFIAMLLNYGRYDVFQRLPAEFRDDTDLFRKRIGALLPHVPPPLRTQRIMQVNNTCVFTTANRERARAAGLEVLPFAAYANDLFDGLVGFLDAAVSPATIAALGDADREGSRPAPM